MAFHSYWGSFNLFVDLNDSLVAANCPKLSLWDSKAVMAALCTSDHEGRGLRLADVLVDGGAVPTLDGCGTIKVLCLCVEGQVGKWELCKEKGRRSGAVQDLYPAGWSQVFNIKQHHRVLPLDERRWLLSVKG